MVRSIEQSAMRKIYLRLLPFSIPSYFFCCTDRINVGFAGGRWRRRARRNRHRGETRQ